MRDPHLEALYYRVSSEGVVTYKNPDTLRVSSALADFTIEKGELKVKPKEHFGSEKDALSAVEPRSSTVIATKLGCKLEVHPDVDNDT